MRHDAVELGFPTRHGRRREKQRPKPLKPPAVAVVDEAFAGFIPTDVPVLPVDVSIAGKTVIGEWCSTKSTLVASLSAQLDALDRQREQLARLLRSIDTNALAE